ncbi:chromosome condensation protein CrcB [Methyloprofundus sedimenti]|uniref:Fluoride-specific ion channel FluC n=1 Tax=Methyloprofundus sedimenti TaxID=1420851 RepID=A0A1V8M2Y6_9GAMM|nr:fluoride efflux transporter CrcB [Methyloprofundus sedimenti]OQK15793.1 chromosome condensation protein CrcB [Methyloprofundus sedimenti]
MNSLIAVALGGAGGAVLRFLVSSGVYQWMGRGFPYGTLAVNIIGSFFIGLLTEALILQRIAVSLEYRAAILVGFLGAFTTFSTFSLETIYLLEQGNITKALLNIMVSVCACLFAVWIGLLLARTLLMYSGGVARGVGWALPYALMVVNAIGVFMVGLIATALMQKVDIIEEYKVALAVILVGIFITLSGLYLILYLIESGFSIKTHLNLMLGVFLINTLVCLLSLWVSLLVGKQL